MRRDPFYLKAEEVQPRFHEVVFQDDLRNGISLEEESQDLSSKVLPPGLLVVHDASGSCQDDVSELPGGQ